MWACVLSTALGLWLMAAPAALGYGAPASIVDRVIGPIAASAAWIAVWEATRGARWLNLPLGVGLALAPFVLGYPAVPLVHDVAVGLALAALPFAAGRTTQRLGGGWRSLLGRSEARRQR